ncbi:MAG: HEAT repeat domain-containing protein [Mesorhizobium sp.]|uniref:HEAT repeat domain-containing protein n=1 Tax=Mesorhizobium sp. TaxID=1871066 RepID=UPI0012234EF8|nr:HEAT repeat domain-containing protein [Mesorhizobium sp.]TIN03935.1 MAG: HEAT repeat domain-containing protein [Mesorhizobium sp.]
MLHTMWLTSIALSAASLLVMMLLIVRRVVVRRRVTTDATDRQRLFKALIAFSEDKDAARLKAVLRSVPPRVTLDGGFEFLGLVRGEEHAQIVAIFVESGLRGHILAQLRKGNEAERIHTAEMLAVLPSDDTVAGLLLALEKDRSREVRIAVAIALCELQALPPLPVLLAKIGVRGQRSRRLVELFGRFPSDRIAEVMEFAAREAEPAFVRAAAIEALGQSGDLQLADFLSASAKDPSSEVSAAAIRAIGRIGHPDARAIVVEAMSSEHWDVRADAAEAAGKFGSPEMIEPLIKLIDDEEWTVRYAAGRAIRMLSDQGLEALELLASVDGSRAQRMASLVLSEGKVA